MPPNPSDVRIFHSGLLYIPKALCNEKALFALLTAGLLAMALTFLGQIGSVPFVTVILTLIILLAILPAGASVAGLLLMDQARGQTPRPLRQALSDSIPVFRRISGIALLSTALMLIFMLFLGIVLLVCKLPAVGPVLYAALFPVLLILGGLLYLGLIVGLSIACPAIWNGATIREALEMLRQIIIHRTPELLANLLLLALLITLAKFILTAIIFIGSLPVLLTSAVLLNTDLNLFTTILSSTTGGHALALTFGFTAILALMLTALVAMTMMGFNLIYLRITKHLPEAATAPKNTKTASICPHCNTTTQLDDRFCGECGGSLQD
jgi:hypothetical protein